MRCLMVPLASLLLLSCTLFSLLRAWSRSPLVRGPSPSHDVTCENCMAGFCGGPCGKPAVPRPAGDCGRGVTLQNTDAVAVCTDSTPSRGSHPEGRGACPSPFRGLSFSAAGSDVDQKHVGPRHDLHLLGAPLLSSLFCPPVSVVSAFCGSTLVCFSQESGTFGVVFQKIPLSVTILSVLILRRL